MPGVSLEGPAALDVKKEPRRTAAAETETGAELSSIFPDDIATRRPVSGGDPAAATASCATGFSVNPKLVASSIWSNCSGVHVRVLLTRRGTETRAGGAAGAMLPRSFPPELILAVTRPPRYNVAAARPAGACVELV
jgi:flavin reductase (DIM6/NTAB) family NADH-FMN oxidoreductase RutF